MPPARLFSAISSRSSPELLPRPIDANSGLGRRSGRRFAFRKPGHDHGKRPPPIGRKLELGRELLGRLADALLESDLIDVRLIEVGIRVT